MQVLSEQTGDSLVFFFSFFFWLFSPIPLHPNVSRDGNGQKCDDVVDFVHHNLHFSLVYFFYVIFFFSFFFFFLSFLSLFSMY